MFEASAVDRRGAMARMAMLLGATTLPFEAFAATGVSAKGYFGTDMFALLSAVADTMIPKTDTPGALDAKVPARLNLMLANWASPATRDALGGALLRIAASATGEAGKPFVKLNAKDRAIALRSFDAKALVRSPLPPGTVDQPFGSRRTFADPEYWRLKQLIIDLYYFSPEATATELVYEHVPGRYEPSIKLTPQSRPFL